MKSLGNIDEDTEQQFYLHLTKMCALFKNAHLFVRDKKIYKNQKFLKQRIIYLNNKAYILNRKKFYEISQIGDINISEICKKISEYIACEVKEWRDIKLNDLLNTTIMYDILGIDYSNIMLKNGSKILVETSSEWINYEELLPPYDKDYSKPFNFTIIEPNIIKINYTTCGSRYSDKFKVFLEDIKKTIYNHNLSFYILDFRGNMGGNSEMIIPLLEHLKEKDMQGVALTDNRVFSSGVFAVYYSKTILNSKIIGQPLAQPNARFGQATGKIELDNDLFIEYTEKFFDFSKVFKGNNNIAIQPDIHVPLTIEDIENKYDRTLNTALDYIKSKYASIEKSIE